MSVMTQWLTPWFLHVFVISCPTRGNTYSPCPDLSTFEPPVFRERANLKRVTSPNCEKYLAVSMMSWQDVPGIQFRTDLCKSLKVPPYRWSKTWFPVDFPSIVHWSNGQTLGHLEELVQHFNSIHRLSRHRAPYISSVHIAWPAGDPLEHFLICCSKKPSGIWPL